MTLRFVPIMLFHINSLSRAEGGPSHGLKRYQCLSWRNLENSSAVFEIPLSCTQQLIDFMHSSGPIRNAQAVQASPNSGGVK